jgi:hypothetical protein
MEHARGGVVGASACLSAALKAPDKRPPEGSHTLGREPARCRTLGDPGRTGQAPGILSLSKNPSRDAGMTMERGDGIGPFP